MIKTIIRPSDALAIFFSELEHPLSKPQQQHVIRIVEGLIVGQGRKTLSQLYAHWVDAPDASAVADFLRVSPWSDGSLNQMVAEMSLSDIAKLHLLRALGCRVPQYLGSCQLSVTGLEASEINAFRGLKDGSWRSKVEYLPPP